MPKNIITLVNIIILNFPFLEYKKCVIVGKTVFYIMVFS